MDDPEIIDISDFGNTININNSVDDVHNIGGGKSSNFGIELLMNDKKKGGSRGREISDDIGLDSDNSSIIYSTGVLALTFTTAPDNATDIDIDYDYNTLGYERSFAHIAKIDTINISAFS